MSVRCKLDTCGIKLKLDQWNTFNLDDRQQLVTVPCQTSEEVSHYRQLLTRLITERAQSQVKELAIDPHPPWLNTQQIPDNVQANLERVHQTVTLDQWRQLTTLQRFALIKLSRPGHESHNFEPALKEFGLTES